LGAQIRSLSQELPRYQSTINEKLLSLRQSLRAPGPLSGAMETISEVQKQVQDAEPAESPEDRVQRVEIVPDANTPLEQAAAWLLRLAEPLATAGIVIVFVFLALIDRRDLRDRFLRMLGGNLHRTTDAMYEAGERISKYLVMQLVVNVTYGV